MAEYQWTVEHFHKIAKQVLKRWQDNPTSITPSTVNGRGGRTEYDFSYIHIKDIEFMARVTGPFDRDTTAYISLKEHTGCVNRPGFFDFKRRKMFDEAVDIINKVQYEMRHGIPSLGDKLLCEAFPELFEEYLGCGSQQKKS